MSNKRRKTRLVREVERWLKATGLAYSITPGTKHFQVVLMGECIGVLSYGTGSNVDGRNLLAIITKKAKEHAANQAVPDRGLHGKDLRHPDLHR